MKTAKSAALFGLQAVLCVFGPACLADTSVERFFFVPSDAQIVQNQSASNGARLVYRVVRSFPAVGVVQDWKELAVKNGWKICKSSKPWALYSWVHYTAKEVGSIQTLEHRLEMLFQGKAGTVLVSASYYTDIQKGDDALVNLPPGNTNQLVVASKFLDSETADTIVKQHFATCD